MARIGAFAKVPLDDLVASCMSSYLRDSHRPQGFQILHCGLDDLWGDFSTDTGAGGQLSLGNTNYIPRLLFPDGPFIGDIADTVSNFYGGTLEDEQQ